MSTLVEPHQMILAILIDQLQQGKAASVSRNLVHLFVLQLYLRQAQQYRVFLYYFGPEASPLVFQPMLKQTVVSTTLMYQDLRVN